MNIKRNPFNRAIKIALYSGMLANFALTGTVFTEEEVDKKELESMEVTGSRIKLSDIEGALPITVISREEIELTGESRFNS